MLEAKIIEVTLNGRFPVGHQLGAVSHERQSRVGSIGQFGNNTTLGVSGAALPSAAAR